MRLCGAMFELGTIYEPIAGSDADDARLLFCFLRFVGPAGARGWPRSALMGFRLNCDRC